jgi:uncharacterized protein
MCNRGPRYRNRLAWLLIPLLLACTAFASIDIDSLKPEGYLSDYARVVDPATKQKIEQYCHAVDATLGVQIALVTISSLDGQPIDDFSIRLARHFQPGQKEKNTGVLVLLAIKDHKYRIEVGYGVEPDLTDGMSGSILRSLRPQLRASQYGQALLTAAQDIAIQVAHSRGVAPPPDALPRRQPPARSSGGIPIPLIILGIFVLFWLLGRGGRGGRGRGGGLLSGLLLGSMLGRGSSGWGGGGFGGYDSGGGGGGGFGGFGGGGFGSGGASSDW